MEEFNLLLKSIFSIIRIKFPNTINMYYITPILFYKYINNIRESYTQIKY